MSGHTVQGIVIIAVMAAATLLSRFLPFILFPAGKKSPEYISFLGTTLPYATIGLLVVYCLKGVNLVSWPHALPEILSVAAIVLLHIWKGNWLLIIGAWTVIYMVLVQGVFR